MKMKGYIRYTREEKISLLKNQKKSGNTIKQWCRKSGISTASFYKWRKELNNQRNPIILKKEYAKREESNFIEIPKEKSSIPEIKILLGDIHINISKGGVNVAFNK